MQKQLASERNEPSGGLATGKGRRLFPSQVTRSARLARFFTLSILFFAFYPTKEPGPRLGEKLNRKEIEATYAAEKNPEKKFRRIQDANILPMQLVLHQYQSMVQIL